ncbi:MAG: hypothetical protein AB2559_15595 [Candidatus Thiodiazotropha endolucinida]
MMNVSIKRLGGMLAAAVRLSFKFIGEAIGLLASSAQTTPDNDELNNSFRGGVMNHRTGKFDDGSDPAGWYERD